MRACDSPAQAGTGLDCVGEDTDFQSCNTESCDSKYPLQSNHLDICISRFLRTIDQIILIFIKS